ncbi:MAG: hypothetical protein NZ853_10850 [Leptospiraceae bacterium]|nr:hypothetical protein [Leptospiraceae bacterium]MDW7977048.1 hypothetical protein [Leptospiraceae bacterium]
MNFLDLYPDLKFFFKNIHIQGKVLTPQIDQQLKEIYENELSKRISAAQLISIDMMLKELIQNSIKANIKKWIIQRYKLNPNDKNDYKKALRILKHILYFVKIEDFETKIDDFDNYFEVFLSFDDKVLIIHVLNEGILLQEEEKRIRRKFRESKQDLNIYDYYLQKSDTEEGAGMGILIVIMILKQLGFSERHFAIFCVKEGVHFVKTVSRLYIPFKNNYSLPRQRFSEYCERFSIKPHVLRKKIHSKKIYLRF